MKKNKLLTIVAIIAGVVILVVLVVVLTGNGLGGTKGTYDDFAKCLKEKEATLYTTYWCPHCTDQKEKFGTSLKYLDVVECDPGGENPNPAKCEEAGISSIPAWVLAGGEKMTGVQTMETLSEKTGCKLDI